MPTFPLTSNRKGIRNSDNVARYRQGPAFSCSLEMIPLVRGFNRNSEANTLPCSLGAVYRIPMSTQSATTTPVPWDTVRADSSGSGGPQQLTRDEHPGNQLWPEFSRK